MYYLVSKKTVFRVSVGLQTKKDSHRFKYILKKVARQNLDLSLLKILLKGQIRQLPLAPNVKKRFIWTLQIFRDLIVLKLSSRIKLQSIFTLLLTLFLLFASLRLFAITFKYKNVFVLHKAGLFASGKRRF